MTLDALIISSGEDLHAQVVAQEIEKIGGSVAVIDSADFPTRFSIVAVYPGGNGVEIRTHAGAESWFLNSGSGVWWRRPRSHDISKTVAHPKLRSFAINECRQAFLGALQSITTNFINPVGNSRQANVKPYQLRVAESVGFATPKTLVTNDPHEARQFIKSLNGDCVYKPFTGTDFGFFETRRFEGDEDLTELWRIQDCPIQIQEHVRGTHDLRVTIVGDRVFCASMDLSKSRHGVDCRVDRLPTAQFKLSDDVAARLCSLTEKLGLIYAAIDLRLTTSGELIFFEVNPEGQYLWTEIDTGMPISNALAQRLCNGSICERRSLLREAYRRI